MAGETQVDANSEQNKELPLTARERSNANLKRWAKGQSGNPNGRPKTPITDAYRRLCKRKPVGKDGKPGDRTYAQLLAEGQFRSAIKGKTDAAKEITERLEGKVPQATHVSGPDGEPIKVDIDVRERIKSITERLRNRAVKSS